MSDDILTTAEYRRDYLQSPVDDLFSFYYTMQQAAVFHDQEFVAEDIPFDLNILRENLVGSDRSSTTLQIITPSLYTPLGYGSVLTDCQPVLRDLYFELQGLNRDWTKCQFELRGEDTIQIPLFSTFALRGVAMLAELVYRILKRWIRIHINFYF